MTLILNRSVSVQQSLQTDWKECEDNITFCLYNGQYISQELLLKAWKCFADYPQCLASDRDLNAMIIIKSNPETFSRLIMTQETFDKIYMAALRSGIVKDISESVATPLMPCGGVQTPLSLVAMRSEYFRTKFSTTLSTEVSSGVNLLDVPKSVFQLWSSFVRTNDIPNESTDLLDALFFAHEIMCTSFLKMLATQLWDAAIIPNLSRISTTLEKAVINKIPQEKKNQLSNNNNLFVPTPSKGVKRVAKSRVQSIPAKPVDEGEQVATFQPKQVLDLKKMGANFKTWNMSSLAPIQNSDERNSMMEEMLAVIFHLLDPKNTLSVETLVLSHNVITFMYTYTEEEVMQCLRKFPNVSQLDLSNTPFDSRPDLFEWVLSAFPNLKELNLSGCCFDSKTNAFPALKNACHLEILNLRGAKNTSKMLSSLVDLKHLRVLNLRKSIGDYRVIPKELLRKEHLKISLTNNDLKKDSALYGYQFPDSILFQAVAYQNLDDIFWILKNHNKEASYREKETQLGLMQCLLERPKVYSSLNLAICDMLSEVTPQSIIERDREGLTPFHYLIGFISSLIKINENVEDLIIMAQKWLQLAKPEVTKV